MPIILEQPVGGCFPNSGVATLTVVANGDNLSYHAVVHDQCNDHSFPSEMLMSRLQAVLAPHYKSSISIRVETNQWLMQQLGSSSFAPI